MVPEPQAQVPPWHVFPLVVQLSPHVLQLVFVPRLTQLLPLQQLLEHWMGKVQLPLLFLVAQLVVVLSQYFPRESQFWGAEPQEPLPLHTDALRMVIGELHDVVPQLCPEAGK